MSQESIAVRTAGISLVAGLLFGAGLVVSGMTMPSKVIGFLDLFGQWDASLIFVMVGAIAVHFVVYRLVLRRSSPLLGGSFTLPTSTSLDKRLIGGAALFGVGWALGGFCPGPALTSAASGAGTTLLFVASMLAGMVLFSLVQGALNRRQEAAEEAETSEVEPAIDH